MGVSNVPVVPTDVEGPVVTLPRDTETFHDPGQTWAPPIAGCGWQAKPGLQRGVVPLVVFLDGIGFGSMHGPVGAFWRGVDRVQLEVYGISMPPS
jgi:hypothetical protein